MNIDIIIINFVNINFVKINIINVNIITPIHIANILDSLPLFLGVGTASLAGSCVGSVNLDSNRGFLPSLENPNNKFFVYLPHVHHTTLSLCRDEIFLKICKMKGISFDMKKRKGTLFFHVDKLLGECISTICIESTKQKSLINAINTLNFIIDSFGKDSRNFSSSSLSSILYNLQTILKKEIKMGKKNGYKNLYLK